MCYATGKDDLSVIANNNHIVSSIKNTSLPILLTLKALQRPAGCP